MKIVMYFDDIGVWEKPRLNSNNKVVNTFMLSPFILRGAEAPLSTLRGSI